MYRERAKGKVASKVVKKWDIIIIALLIIVSFIPYTIFRTFILKDTHIVYAKITVDGKNYDKIKLTGHKGKEEFVIQTEAGYNKVIIEEEKIGIIEADCPDKVCIRPGFISKPGQSLICLPHKLSISIEGNADEENEIDIMVY